MRFSTGTFSVAIPVYKRQVLLPFTIQRWLDMNVKVVCVCSTRSDADFLSKYEPLIEILTAPNKPLGNKWNVGFKRASEVAEYVIFAGSTDWIHHTYLQQVCDNPEADYWGSLGCSWLELYRNAQKPFVLNWPGYANMGERFNPAGLRSHETIGIGRVMRSKCIQDMFELYDGPFKNDLDNSLDHSMRTNLLRLNNAATKNPIEEHVLPTTDYHLVSLGCADVWTNKHQINDLVAYSSEGCFDTLLTFYPEAKKLAENVKSCPIEK
jgi:glycosyltransferase involved in cell wall biosynthesis